MSAAGCLISVYFKFTSIGRNRLHELRSVHFIGNIRSIIILEDKIKMDEEYSNDDDVWNASAVILDIDSGVLHEDLSWFWFSFFFFTKLHKSSQLSSWD